MRIDDIMGRWNRHREIEAFLTTFDGAQHLRLHGWLKKNDVLIKSENIADLDDYFGVFTIYINETMLKKLKKEKDRTDKIAELYKDNSKLIDDALETSKTKPKEKKVKKKEVKLSKSEKYKKSLFKMKKQDQINRLMELGYPSGRISQFLKYEKDRVEMIIKLESKKK